MLTNPSIFYFLRSSMNLKQGYGKDLKSTYLGPNKCLVSKYSMYLFCWSWVGNKQFNFESIKDDLGELKDVALSFTLDSFLSLGAIERMIWRFGYKVNEVLGKILVRSMCALMKLEWSLKDFWWRWGWIGTCVLGREMERKKFRFGKLWGG